MQLGTEPRVLVIHTVIHKSSPYIRTVNMVQVAVLGGSGHVGKTIVEVLSEDQRHSVVVLGRSVSTDLKTMFIRRGH
jgi:hypothetical protein